MSRALPEEWNESDSFRETTLQNFDDPEDREAIRRVGRLLYDLAVETSQDLGTSPEPEGDPSLTRAELRAIAADLRYLAGYCAMVGRMAEDFTLERAENALAHFAGDLSGKVGALVGLIEEALVRNKEEHHA
jgi:hypothetical protein